MWERDEAVCKIFEEIEERGRKKGENRLASLIQLLLRERRYDEIRPVSSDAGKRAELYQRYGILE